MIKFIFILLFVFKSFESFAVPARLGGFTYSKDDLGRPLLTEKSEIFNEGPPALMEDLPPIPFYLNDDLSDARTGVSRRGDKYKLAPLYSEKSLYENSGYTEEGFIEDEYVEENDEFFE